MTLPARMFGWALLLGAAPSATAQETITWLVPEFVLSEAQPAGHAQKLLSEPMIAHLIAHWPDAHHEVVTANIKRSMKMIEAGEHVCHLVALHSPERESIAYFVDTHLAPPLQLIVQRAKLNQVPRNAAGEVDLARLMGESLLRGALVDGRSYGPVIDGLVARRPERALSFYSPSDFGGRLLQMISLGRIDYSIDFDFTLQQLREQSPGIDELVSLPIQGASALTLSSIACPRNEWGRRTTARLDRIFLNPAGVAALRRHFDRWLTRESRQRYGARIDAFYAELQAGRR